MNKLTLAYGILSLIVVALIFISVLAQMLLLNSKELTNDTVADVRISGCTNKFELIKAGEALTIRTRQGYCAVSLNEKRRGGVSLSGEYLGCLKIHGFEKDQVVPISGTDQSVPFGDC